MADLPQYTGVTYDAEMYKKPDETMSEYMLRLSKLRAAGVLGGGGMLDTPTKVIDPVAAAPLGQVVVNTSSSGDGVDNGAVVAGKQETNQQKLDRMMGNTFDPASLLNLVPVVGGLLSAAVDTGRKNDLAEALKEAGYSKAEIDAMKENEMLMANTMYRDPNMKFEGAFSIPDSRRYSVEGIVGDLFGLNKTPAQMATQYAQARAVNPSMFSQATNISAAQLANPNYLGTAASGTPTGFSSDGSTYTSSYGGSYDTSNMSSETKAGLDAVSSGVFDTPSWYSEDY